MLNFWEKLDKSSRDNKSALVVGLDPDVFKMPEGIDREPHGVHEFLGRIVASTSDHVCAFKPNLSFYLMMGAQGIEVLRAMTSRIPKHIPIILDCKFGDVGHTAERFAYFAREHIRANAVTINPYIGTDTIKPFLEAGLDVFLLCATSNPSYAEVEGITADGMPLYAKVAELAEQWMDKFDRRMGLVVGATHPGLFEEIRNISPNSHFLVPGIGAQGGELESALKCGKTKDGSLPLIVSARVIIYASACENFDDAARAAAIELKTKINAIGGFYDEAG